MYQPPKLRFLTFSEFIQPVPLVGVSSALASFSWIKLLNDASVQS